MTSSKVYFHFLIREMSYSSSQDEFIKFLLEMLEMKIFPILNIGEAFIPP